MIGNERSVHSGAVAFHPPEEIPGIRKTGVMGHQHEWPPKSVPLGEYLVIAGGSLFKVAGFPGVPRFEKLHYERLLA